MEKTAFYFILLYFCSFLYVPHLFLHFSSLSSSGPSSPHFFAWSFSPAFHSLLIRSLLHQLFFFIHLLLHILVLQQHLSPSTNPFKSILEWWWGLGGGGDNVGWLRWSVFYCDLRNFNIILYICWLNKQTFLTNIVIKIITIYNNLISLRTISIFYHLESNVHICNYKYPTIGVILAFCS